MRTHLAPREASGPGRGYSAFRWARTAIWLALRARHLALAAAGPRQAHTYHQYAIRLPQPAATTRTAPAMRRTHARDH
jgi:hypothetical protein